MILTCMISKYRAYNVYRIDRHLLTWPRFWYSRNILFLSLFLSFTFVITFPFLSRFFYVPSKPHAHGYARLKIWNQCDQNGCYGRAPVYRTVSIRPEAGPMREKFYLTIAPWARVRSNEHISYDSVSFLSRSHRSHQYYDLKGKKKSGIHQRSWAQTKLSNGLEDKVSGPQNAPRAGDRRVLLFIRGISRYIKIIIN